MLVAYWGNPAPEHLTTSVARLALNQPFDLPKLALELVAMETREEQKAVIVDLRNDTKRVDISINL